MSSVGKDRRARQNEAGIHKTTIRINVYDLLPPGKLSTVLWTFGCGLLHTGVAIGEKEYAFGGHDKKGITGVYWMKPGTEPGGTFRCEIVHGHTTASEGEITDIVIEASEKFLGPTYNLLTRNCNHFTSYLCEKLTGKPAPKWINRAAGIGVNLPCIVPAEWVEPPECEEPMEGDNEDEGARLVEQRGPIARQSYHRQSDDGFREVDWASESSEDEWGDRRKSYDRKRDKRVTKDGPYLRDEGGRALPSSERAPLR